ncbi:gamma-glutamyl-gamma-aminobutyrate hydrolase family protein [Candidatus Enterovibrio altilux]|uniref:gamma-glutamyl-gamma-aminobutyrate hydrolase n=1 Tax=Candidatus Enterovibrio altilux TaxID=1927128 RepID=A0A291B7X3_9GAMM|nr:gamma-glutamyl-gamma-aminobutyrate hydrolase family protein [Candidatus Enterovibrio luxaltus]ATF09090.1 Gamma-glutamyl-GABA hydrolase [Candidatus Enterovibrio luxaltus]
MPHSIIPIVGVVSCTSKLGLHLFHIAGEKYLSGVFEVANCCPLIIPVLGKTLPIETFLALCDGILFTGSTSNIEPHHYDEEKKEPSTDYDPQRDATTLPLMRHAITVGVPVLAICRGFQEMNVVMGGTLHQKLHDIGGFIEHHEDKITPAHLQYGISHTVNIEPGGIIYEAWGRTSAEVNSVHTQGVDRLGNGLRPEAYAPDGLVEAVSVINSKQFALGVQWHPEWEVIKNPFYSVIFKVFGNACRLRANNSEKNHG